MQHLHGVIAASVTAFNDDYTLNLKRSQQHFDALINAGVHGILLLGGSGEYVSLEPGEREALIRAASESINGRVPLYVGVLSPGTPEALTTARAAAKHGANGLLVLPPYYVKPSFAGVKRHFQEVAQVSSLPIILYNIPARTGWNMTVDHMAELVESVPNVVGAKDCERDVAALSTKIAKLGGEFALLSGDDDLAFATLLSGAPGGIWTSPNVVPELCVDLYEACASGNVSQALELHRSLVDLMSTFFIPNHPGPLKELMAMAGNNVGPARPPLATMSPEEAARAKAALELVIEKSGHGSSSN